MTVASYRTDNPYTPHDAFRPLEPRFDRPLRILISSYRSHPYTGGQGVYMRFLTRALADMGHTVDVISGPPYPELDARVGLIKLDSLDLYAQPKTSLGIPAMPARAWRDYIDFYEYISHVTGAFPEPETFGMRMARYLRGREGDYDIVHDNQTLCSGLLDLQRRGMSVVGALHHPITRDRQISLDHEPSFWMRLLVKRWYSFLDRQIQVARQLDPLMVCSNSTKRDAAVDFGLAPERLELVYLGIDTELFRPLPHIPRAPQRLITTASADVPLKGLIYLIEAYAALLPEHPDLDLMVIGKLREGQTSALLDRLGIRDKVTFVSGLTFEEIAELYAQATIAVSPSVYEGFGFPAGEAMACGVPLVSTSGGSLPEVVGDAGLQVPPRDAPALAKAIASLLTDPARRETLARLGRERITRQFTWARTARKVTQIYHRVLSSRQWSANAHHRPQIATS